MNNKQWFVLKGESKFGPFQYSDLISMMQNKALFDFDYVWTEGFDVWKPLADLEDFSAAQLKNLANENEELFNRRTCPRVELSKNVYVHNDTLLWRGRTITLSEKGALVLMENPSLLPSQLVTLHFKNADGHPSFNVVAEIIAKKSTKERLHQASCLRYAIRFLRVGAPGEELLKTWTYEDYKPKLKAVGK